MSALGHKRTGAISSLDCRVGSQQEWFQDCDAERFTPGVSSACPKRRPRIVACQAGRLKVVKTAPSKPALDQ